MVAAPVGCMHPAKLRLVCTWPSPLVQVAAREAQWAQLTHELAACFAENEAAMQDTEEESAAMQRCQHLQDVLKERQGVHLLGLVSLAALVAGCVGKCCMNMFQLRDSAKPGLRGWRGQGETPAVSKKTT